MLGGPPREPPLDATAVSGRDPASVLTAALLLVLAALAWARVLFSPMDDDMAGMAIVMGPPLAAGLPDVAAWAGLRAARRLSSALAMSGLSAATPRHARPRTARVAVEP